MTYCECPFPIFRASLDVANRERMKCDRCKRYEDPEEAAENGRPIDDSIIRTGSVQSVLGDLFDGELRRQKG